MSISSFLTIHWCDDLEACVLVEKKTKWENNRIKKKQVKPQQCGEETKQGNKTETNKLKENWAGSCFFFTHWLHAAQGRRCFLFVRCGTQPRLHLKLEAGRGRLSFNTVLGSRGGAVGVTVSICSTSSCLVVQEATFQTKAQEKPPQTPAADLVTVQRISFGLHQDDKGYCGQRILVWLLLENNNNENTLR